MHFNKYPRMQNIRLSDVYDDHEWIAMEKNTWF